MATPEFISPEEFSARVRCSMSTVWRMLRKRQLPAIQPGGRRKRWLINWTEFVRQTNERSLHLEEDSIKLEPAPERATDRVISGPCPTWMKTQRRRRKSSEEEAVRIG